MTAVVVVTKIGEVITYVTLSLPCMNLKGNQSRFASHMMQLHTEHTRSKKKVPIETRLFQLTEK